MDAAEVLKFLAFWDESGTVAGRLCVLNSFYEREFQNIALKSITGRYRDREVDAKCCSAAMRGDLPALQYFHENGYSWDGWTCCYASSNGHLDCLRYAHEKGCEWDSIWIGECCREAAKYGHLDCLRYAYENGAYLEPQAASMAARFGRVDCFRYCLANCKSRVDLDTASENAAERGNLDGLRVAHELGGSLCDVCRTIAFNGYMATQYNDPLSFYGDPKDYWMCMMYAHEHGAPWDKHTSQWCASNIDHLKYVIENGCPLNEETCRMAARSGSLDCLKYAHEIGCSWNEETCRDAAEFGSLACLKYAHENGCSWNVDTFQRALAMGNIDCLTYAHENDCPCDAGFFAEPLHTHVRFKGLSAYEVCLNYLREKGYPCDGDFSDVWVD